MGAPPDYSQGQVLAQCMDRLIDSTDRPEGGEPMRRAVVYAGWPWVPRGEVR